MNNMKCRCGLILFLVCSVFILFAPVNVPSHTDAVRDDHSPSWKEFFAAYQPDFSDILFIKRERLPGSEGRGHHMCDQYFGFNQLRHPKNGLYILKDAFSDNPNLVNLLENSVVRNGRRQGERLEGGAFISPNLSYCGTEVVFAYTDGRGYRGWDETTVFHIYRVNIDGTELIQLTDGSWNDFDPVFLPDGDIAFISERRGGFGRCHGRPVPTYTLHRMTRDGSNIRTISFHETNEWNPSVDNQGMIIYTRWDYVDRGATHMHSAWIAKPDGGDARALTLNYPIPNRPSVSDGGWLGVERLGRPGHHGVPCMQMGLRAIPGSNRIVGTAAMHHGQIYGPPIMIDPDIEDDDGVATITHLARHLNPGYPESSGGQQRFATPYPLTEEQFLIVYSPDNGRHTKYGLYLLDTSGSREELAEIYRDGDISLLSPIPVRPRPVPNIIPAADMPREEDPGIPVRRWGGPGDVRPDELPELYEGHPAGKVLVANVYDTLLPLPEGTLITALRIWQLYPKTTFGARRPAIAHYTSGGASRNARGLLGMVPVEADGSAYFEMPSGKAVFFQAVAEDGTAVQSMKSAAFIVPGENFMSCQGCHEPRHTTPSNPPGVLKALQREPSKIEAGPDGSKPLSFPRLIQPILDKRCISCHDGGTDSPVPDLRSVVADYGWFRSYINLKPYVFLYEAWYGGNHDRSFPRTEPGIFGARASRLYHHLKTGHGEISEDELQHVVLWLDSNIAPFYGVYRDLGAQQAGEQLRHLYD